MFNSELKYHQLYAIDIVILWGQEHHFNGCTGSFKISVGLKLFCEVYILQANLALKVSPQVTAQYF